MTGKIASIQARLKNIYRQGGSSYQLILTRYFQERLLFRLSMLEARNNFLLKGGVLIYALDGVASRPTLDLDLLARKISPDPAVLREVFLSIGELDYPEDGVVFDTKEMELTEIIKEGNYRGIRIKIWASLGNIRQRLQIDVGFGDKVVPGPVTIHFPTLLAMQGPELLAYSKESLVAEKFEAMISLAEYNSRMKDFYDVYRILQSDAYDKKTLRQAIRTTFEHRGTPIVSNHVIFSNEFKEDRERKKQWKNFLSRVHLDSNIEFPTVMALIQQKLEPIYSALVKA